MLKALMKDLNTMIVGKGLKPCRWLEKFWVSKPWRWLERRLNLGQTLIKQQLLVVLKAVKAGKFNWDATSSFNQVV